ncbi:acyltransferase family protein [Nocardioides pocheonensis]|uniref:Acyltransferase n=1 Tax=Nocardioides pocheonensis TaxID=661485 RepID=A0A3N0GW92_9ACTN|nr:acyltransferase family protein [Nocardioides pocheonensis]RNM16725.1 acyltransferase [Nocardioides pocheonensis]
MQAPSTDTAAKTAAEPAAGAAATAADSRRSVRTDIQGLRAIAVSLVLVYHLAPHTLTGGFTGVDVFFVISGFLITLHLLERMPAHPRDLGMFWSRRVRRLLPASLLVLAVTLAGSRLVAPETQWENTARQARAAVLYVVNWLLARDAVDYLAAENAPSPVQHFWSLSVEEQFYFVWPVLILVLGALARAMRRRPLPVVLAGLVVLVAASLAYSIHDTATNPPAAYFVTPTRMWELGVGGLLATFTLLRPGRIRPWAATAFAWVGLLAIGWAAATYTGRTPFPGWQAAMPVLGTAAVIAAQPPDSWRRAWLSPGPLLALRPVQWLGDISYSVYLWHWPLIVLVPAATGHALTWTDRGAILAATLLLAWLTKLFVEDRFRAARWGIPLRKPFALAAAAMAVVIGLAGAQLAEVHHRSERAAAVLAKGLAGKDPCFGSRALDHPKSCPDVAYADVVPAPIEAAQDKSDAYDNQANGHDCWAYQPSFPTKQCIFGDATSAKNVVLVGNSHAGQWLPALQQVAADQHLKITTMLASRCALSDVRQQFDTAANATACLTWVHRTTQRVVALHPDLVVMANRISVGAETDGTTSSEQLYLQGYASILRTWRDAGIRTVVLRDTPAPGVSVPDCIAEKKTAYRDCNGTRQAWLPPAPEQQAVQQVHSPLVSFVDLTDHICGPTTCSAVTGGVITYFDATHLTATYARTLAPYLGPILAKALGAG